MNALEKKINARGPHVPKNVKPQYNQPQGAGKGVSTFGIYEYETQLYEYISLIW